MAEWIAEGEPSLDLWHMDVRRFGAPVPLARPTRSSASARPTRPTTTSATPATSARPGRPLRVSPANALAPRARRRVRREVRLGAGELVRGERGGRRRVAAPARLGGPALVARDRRRAPRLPRGAWRCSTRRSFAKIEIAGPGAAELLERLCDNRVARDVGRITYTQMLNSPRRDRVRLHRRAARRGALLDRHRHGLRQPRPRVDPPPPARRTARVQVHDVTSAWACFGIWGPRARDVLAPLTPQSLAERGLPLHERCARSPSATCRCARCG